MNRFSKTLRLATRRIKFVVIDVAYSSAWLIRQTTVFVMWLPIEVLRFIWYQTGRILFTLRDAVSAIWQMAGRSISLNGLYELWFFLRWATHHGMRLPLSIFRFLFFETLHLFDLLTHSVVLVSVFIRRFLGYIVWLIFIAPIVWMRPSISPHCCNAVLARSRPQGNELYFRYLLLIGTFRCRYCGNRLYRFWPFIEPTIRKHERARQQSG